MLALQPLTGPFRVSSLPSLLLLQTPVSVHPSGPLATIHQDALSFCSWALLSAANMCSRADDSLFLTGNDDE